MFITLQKVYLKPISILHRYRQETFISIHLSLGIQITIMQPAISCKNFPNAWMQFLMQSFLYVASLLRQIVIFGIAYL